ncbi:ras-like protein [Anaeramoeba ignava]|uniref:Ras-like protein n=1 Tax=Anaeramoeba ignava TaxID=1746090 RepID=A0A9Q0LSN8_ANAIG|nr:ras-like protein [Anaeramoeba ignava]|eukprot:Anaeramoba_ignava/a482267_72.p1 GENE.a482267_72~~a482267_72.p1  ORF type:complete len:208 (-),score=57.40 a482267_72:187-810(-)
MSEIHKIAVVGGGGVGKSCLIIRFLNDVFFEQYDPTTEERYRKDFIIDGKATSLDILDTAGQEEFKTLGDRNFQKMEGFLCVLSVASKPTIGEIRTIIQQIKRIKGDQIVGVLVANKCDIAEEDRVVSLSQAEELAQEFGMKFFSCSAKTGYNVQEAFFQCVREVIKDKRDQELNPRKLTRNKSSVKQRQKARKKRQSESSGCCILI